MLGAFTSFTTKLSNSPKNVVRNVYELIRTDCRSITGSNTRNINLDCAIDEHRPFSGINIEKKEFYPIPPDAAWTIPLIQELIEMRDGLRDSANWTKEDIESTLTYLCTL